jgi:hypothetical protein
VTALEIGNPVDFRMMVAEELTGTSEVVGDADERTRAKHGTAGVEVGGDDPS